MNVEEVIENVYKKCKFYNKSLRVCKGELLPAQRAIERNAEGRGLCDDVKDFIKESKNECKAES